MRYRPQEQSEEATVPAAIPDEVRALLTEPLFFHAATINSDGSPQVSVVWADLDGDLLRFSTAEGRAKPRNLRRDPRITISFTPPDNPYRNVVLIGRAVEIEQRGMDLIDHMARKYTEADSYQWSQPGETRVDIAVEIDRVVG
jgi:PPOX class probable F420-dependent enzyme